MKFAPLSLFLAGAAGALFLSACASQPQSASPQERQHVENLATAERFGYSVQNVDGQFQFCANADGTGSHITNRCMSELEFEQYSTCTQDSQSGLRFCETNERWHAANLAKAERFNVEVRNVGGQFQFCPPGEPISGHKCVSEHDFADN
jgi:hypothetical protein